VPVSLVVLVRPVDVRPVPTALLAGEPFDNVAPEPGVLLDGRPTDESEGMPGYDSVVIPPTELAGVIIREDPRLCRGSGRV
jgi:hypothetical protein